MNAAAFAASYADWKLIRTRKCVQLVFEIPLEKSSEAFTALGGMPNSAAEIWCAIARLDPTKIEVQTSEMVDTRPSDSGASPPGVDAPAGTRTLAQLAGAYCSLAPFQKFLNERAPLGFPIIDEDQAAVALRYLCKVESRRDIKIDTPAGDRFEKIIDDFHQWVLADRYVEAS